MSAEGSLSRDTYWQQGHREAMERLAGADVDTLRAAYEALRASFARRDYASRESRRLQGAMAAVVALTQQQRSA